ncbi:MAG: hypothetical protein ACKVOM_08550 [Ferruginibacter sp.]
MELQLENLIYQDTAFQAVIKVFDGTEKNTFDNAGIEGIRFNFCKLTVNQITDNIKAIAKENGIDDESAKYSVDNDLCIEMETGTGKCLSKKLSTINSYLRCKTNCIIKAKYLAKDEMCDPYASIRASCHKC